MYPIYVKGLAIKYKNRCPHCGKKKVDRDDLAEILALSCAGAISFILSFIVAVKLLDWAAGLV